MSERASAWRGLSTRELERKLAELEHLVDSGMLTDRSLGLQLDEIGIIQAELARRSEGPDGPDVAQ